MATPTRETRTDRGAARKEHDPATARTPHFAMAADLAWVPTAADRRASSIGMPGIRVALTQIAGWHDLKGSTLQDRNSPLPRRLRMYSPNPNPVSNTSTLSG